jgi:hypothetical protein
MSTTIFTAKEICEIIAACGNSGVLGFSFQGLRITFPERKNDGQDELQFQSPGPVTAIGSNRFDESLIRQDELAMKDDELSLLKIEDPLAYERLLMQRELEPDGD